MSVTLEEKRRYRNWYDSRGAKVGRDYVEKVMKQAMKEKTIELIAFATAILIISIVLLYI